MEFEKFKETINGIAPPPGLSIYINAMWYDGNGDWAKAHSLVDSLQDNTASWVHAYLHRKEGDIWNADYWYRRAGKKRPDKSLQEEWEQIIKALL